MKQTVKRIAALVAAVLLWFSGTPALAEESTLNVLLIGVDTAEEGAAGRSDTMMLAQISPQSGQVKLVSFLRDLYVSIPGHGKTRLNAAYMYGGEKLLKETLESLFDVRVDRYATVHFSTLVDVVDQLGGVEIELSEAERKHMNKLLKDAGNANLQLSESGAQRLNGRQALAYSRIRKIDSDFQRTSRQQTLLQAMLQPLSGMGAFSLMRLAVSLIRQVDTDCTLGDLATLSPLFSRMGSLKLETAHVPFDGAYSDETVQNMMVLVPNLDRNQRKLREFLAQ